MTDTSNSNRKSGTLGTNTDVEIDLRQVAKSLIRHKYLIAKITSAAVLLASVYSVISKPVWEGQFEIVLASKKSSTSQAAQLLQSNPGLANLIGIGGSNDQLETEVEILQSPSVLKPVFDFVKDQKQKQGQDVEAWRYTDWIDSNLKIKLVKGTSVLELAYQDTDKNLVLPVIQKISNAYQAYSGRDRRRGINQAIQYLDEQIKIYDKKNIDSLRAAQEYGIEQDLTALKEVMTMEPKTLST